MKKQGVAVAVLLATSPVLAEDAKPMSAIDVAVDYQSLLGQRAIVEGCAFNFVTNERAICTLQTTHGPAGEIGVDTRTMERELLRVLLHQCAGAEIRFICQVDVIATIRATEEGDPMLTDVAGDPR
jgi:hypothetical protein